MHCIKVNVVISIQKLRKLMKFNLSPFSCRCSVAKCDDSAKERSCQAFRLGPWGYGVCVWVCVCVCVFVCARERSLSPVCVHVCVCVYGIVYMCVLGIGTCVSFYFLSPLFCVCGNACVGWWPVTVRSSFLVFVCP